MVIRDLRTLGRRGLARLGDEWKREYERERRESRVGASGELVVPQAS